MYAILDAGGKQYRATPAEDIIVDKLAAEPGQVVEFEQVALVEREGKVTVGKPWVKGAKVTCRVLAHEKGRKIDVFFYKAKENIKRKRGHRQPYTRLRVEKITVGRSRAKKES
ncbi:MAG: 50S ribosomal protein L21 [Armatimonadota bacterium]|nr:50S ribosomal protein L21 [Armatimonadota bacterium]